MRHCERTFEGTLDPFAEEVMVRWQARRAMKPYVDVDAVLDREAAKTAEVQDVLDLMEYQFGK